MRANLAKSLCAAALTFAFCWAPAVFADEVGWQAFEPAGSSLTMKLPQGWKGAVDETTGRIDLNGANGATLSILPFTLEGQTSANFGDGKEFFNTFLKVLAPGESWSEPGPVGKNGMHATYTNAQGSGTAALLAQKSASGLAGLVCIAKMAKSEPSVVERNNQIFAQILSSVRPKVALPDANAGTANTSADAGNLADFNGSEDSEPAEKSGGAGWTRFTDPSEGSFSVDVPEGWTVTGGLTRYGALDVRPWVKAVSPDQLVTAFIGDGKIAPCTMPTATMATLGIRVGQMSNGTLIQHYIPARRFAESYARMNLKPFLSNIQVVQEENHPEVAAAVNGTTGATRSEAATIKLTGMYGETPAVAYYLAVTKATVAYGTGMWWVTKVAGSVGPAEREGEVLGVILHMLGSFEVNQSWAANSLRNTVAVSQHYRRVSQQVSQSISNRYWSQQAHNDRMNQAYWNRQASQDRAANNFSNYIRGVENVRDPGTGTQYQVQYGPQGHFIDSNSNYIYSGDNAPGPDWRQLISVP